MHVFMHILTSTHIVLHEHTTNTYTYAHTYRKFIHTHKYIPIDKCTLHIHTYVCIHTYTHKTTHTYIYIYIQTKLHIYTRSHTFWRHNLHNAILLTQLLQSAYILTCILKLLQRWVQHWTHL
jgi:hypothetical protein